MNYGLTTHPTLKSNECLVIGIFSDTELPDIALNLETTQKNLIKNLSAKATEPGDLRWQNDVDGASILIVQCGPQKQFTPNQLKKRINDITDALIKNRFHNATICMPQLPQHNADWQIEQMLLQVDYQNYQMIDFKKKSPKKNHLEAITFYLPDTHESCISQAMAIAQGISCTRNLANLPANVCTPTYLGEQAQKLAKLHASLSCKVMGLDDIKKLGMHALLAVSQGSEEPPRFIELQYIGTNDRVAPIVLVGKGITFDSGGLAIKPANCMDEMKYDMSGAASVLGTIKACALLKLPVNVVGLIPSAENMISGAAVKPGDIITSMSGQTVEIINTDAEGRLALADALTYAERFNPEFVIDIATLTGAMVVALGTVASGLMTCDEDLAKRIENAAKDSGDRVWRMPLDEEYQDAVDSPLADMLNATFDRVAGGITAACFLSRFTEKYRWAHLDIAGTSWVSGKKRNATGRPVALLTQLIRHAANSR